MKITKASLPYPVCGREDDYKGQQPESWLKIDEKSNDKTHKLSYIIKFDPENTGLIELVENGNAILNIELDCLSTFMRKCIRIDAETAVETLKSSEGGEIIIEIDKKEFAGKISITGYITAVKDFTLENKGRFHSDYGYETFIISPGDVLAVFPCAENIDLQIDWEHMLNNVGAPVKIIEDTSKNALRHTSLDSNYISIYLPKFQYKEFKETLETNPRVNSIVLTAIAKPSIMEALIKLYYNPDSESSWAKAIKARIDSEDIFSDYKPANGAWEKDNLSNWQENFDKIASLILKGADDKMFEQLKEIVNTDNKE